MEKGVFKFKQFSCQHYGSSMRIGVDAVLLGAWAHVDGTRILDVGTGCGVIALMCAQRNPDAAVDAIDTDLPSVSEADINFKASPWSDRLQVIHENYLNFKPTYYYDRIVSNPPYFSSGVDSDISARMHARHEGDLSPISLLRHSKKLLTPSGTVSMIIPYLRTDEIIADAERIGFCITHRLDIRGNVKSPVKRSLLELALNNGISIQCQTSVLTMESAPTIPTDEYRALCRDFYLYF